jgi:hypothetical protein
MMTQTTFHKGDRVCLSPRFRRITGARDAVCIVRAGPDKEGRYEIEHENTALWPLAVDLLEVRAE